jgi:uncharacterized protein
MSGNLENTTNHGREQIKELYSLNGQDLKTLVEAALSWLRTNQQIVNALNVFPVPDGDTGTNMLLTMQAAHNEILESNELNIGKVSHGVAQGALMGARGNSGVILSQLWRGFARAMDNLDTMDAGILIQALAEARNTAYKGVVRPVEGTILTVAKDIAAAAEAAVAESSNLIYILEQIVTAADESVKRTPELLPILKQAGVVDSGGKGLFYIYEGMLRYIRGESLDSMIAAIQPLSALNLESARETIEPGQDFEWVIDFRCQEDINFETFYNDLCEIGTAIQIGEGDNMYRLHIHVSNDNRDLPLHYVEKIGTVLKWTGENLIAQMDELESGQDDAINCTPVEPGQIAVVAVSPGHGISRIFASLGVSAIVEGGQTMNPSTEEIVHAFENLPTDQIIILPNNKNIILAAQTASQFTVKKVAVIPSKSVPQGLSAILRLNPDANFDHVVTDMNHSLQDVETGEITVATRSVELNGVEVKAGEVIALLNGTLIHSSNSIEDATLGLLDKADTADRERITLFYGNNIAKNDVNQIVDKIRKKYPQHEIELHEGGQPHYQFIIAIE